MFSNAKSLEKIQGLLERGIRFLYSDYTSSNKILLLKAGKLQCMSAE